MKDVLQIAKSPDETCEKCGNIMSTTVIVTQRNTATDQLEDTVGFVCPICRANRSRVGDVLYRMRIWRAISLRDAAKVAGMSVEKMSSVERGSELPEPEVVEKLAILYSVTHTRTELFKLLAMDKAERGL